jgi:hypothetical protein
MRVRLVAELLFAQFLVAFSTNALWAAPCVIPPLAPEAISQFKSNPEALIAPGADTRTIEGMVRDLAGTDAGLATDLVRLAEGTNPRIQTAIAAGLAQAAVACQTVDQGAGLQIQQAVAGFMDGQFQDAFAAVAGDLSTAATNAALGAANGSVGSVIVTNPNTAGGPAKNPGGGGGTTPFFQINSSGVAIAPTTATTPTATTTAANPVSATR